METLKRVGADRVKIVQPGAGEVGHLAPGVGVQFKIDGDDTGGLVSIVEHPFEVGAVVPPHVHTLEDEISYVLVGEIGFRSEDQEVVLSPGGYIVKPRGQVHAMWNAGQSPARMIEVITTAGFENFFRELSTLTVTAQPDIEAIGELAGRYQLPFAEPNWFPGIVERYGLTPPPM